MPGGLLFESFLVTAGRRSSQRAILALAKTCRDEDRECTAEEAEELVAAERVGFYFNMLSVLANRGRSANRQLFFLSLLAQAKGLSRTGMEVFAAMNVCLSPRTFDLELNTFLVRVEEHERSCLSPLILMGFVQDLTLLFVQDCFFWGARDVAGQLLEVLCCRGAGTRHRRSRRVPVDCPRASSLCGTRCGHRLAARRARHAHVSLRGQRC